MPKCLIDVDGKTMLERQLSILHDVEVVVVVGFMADDVIAHVRRIRDDAAIVFNPDYRTTGTAASLALGADAARGDVIVSLDGDLLVAESDLRRFVESESPTLAGVTPMSSTTAVGAAVEDNRVVEMGFDTVSAWEWSGLLRMPRSDVIDFGRGHVFESLVPHLPLPCVAIDCVEIDEPEDIDRAVKWVAMQPDHAAAPLDRETITSFWTGKAQSGRTRWTSDSFLEFDRRLLEPLLGETTAILDLGSGFGELSRSICPPGGSLLAVDHEAGFAAAFDDDPRFRFRHADVLDFVAAERFDLALLFGVVTHLDPVDEAALYRHLAAMIHADGVVVVKNQCSDADSFQVDTFSEELATRYVGRYPSVDEQFRRLHDRFARVELVRYPAELKVHDDTSHVAFVCQAPRT
jgi:choline kinase/2-polyprenyl-3-methyl-5-hydroxy-6-metoxy-1,4-benzoquinol methylase